MTALAAKESFFQYTQNSRKEVEMTFSDVIKKALLPLAFLVFWFWMVTVIMEVSGKTELFWRLFLMGLPFGIHKMRIILVPRGADLTATLGMIALSVIIGGLVGCIMIPVVVIQAVYVIVCYIARIK